MKEVSSAALRLMPPTAWYFGSAPLYMTWMFLIVGGLAWFPGVDSESLVVAPFTIVVAQVFGYAAIRLASAHLAPLSQRVGLLIVTTLLSSVGVCGACFVALGLLDNFWLQPCIALGAVASVPLQQAWIEFYSSLERDPSIVSHTGSTLMAFSLSLLLMGFVAPQIPVLATFILVCSGFFTLIAGFMSWTGGGGVKSSVLCDAAAQKRAASGNQPDLDNIPTVIPVELTLGMAYGLLLNLTISPQSPVFTLPLIFLLLVLPTVNLLITIKRKKRLLLYRSAWPVPLIMTCAYVLLMVYDSRSLAVGSAQAAYLYFGIFFSAFCTDLNKGNSPNQRLKFIANGSMFGGIGVTIGALAGVLLHRFGIFTDARVGILVLFVIISVHLAWASLLGNQRHESGLSLAPRTISVPKEVFSTERSDRLSLEHGLTQGEKRVLLGLAMNKTPQVIATEHKVELSTVRSQIKSVYAKLGVHSRQELLDLIRE